MAGGQMQLVAYGAQDVFLTGNPKVTFFQAQYKRHTNFAMEVIQQTVNGSVSNGGRISVTIARNGDLIGEMYMELPSKDITTTGSGSVTSGLDGVAFMAERAITDIELTIGGQRIDKHYQRWWRLYSELYLDESKKLNYAKLTTNATGQESTVGRGVGQCMLPLLFFFNRNPGLYLPLVALPYHEVRLDFDLSGEYTTYFGSNAPIIWGNYVYLDTEERNHFAKKPHEYLIEQVQHTGTDTITVGSENSVRLSYNHPVKELVWCITPDAASGGRRLWDLTTGSSDTTNGIKLDVMNSTASGLYANCLVSRSMAGVPMMVSNDASKVQYCEEGSHDSTTRHVGPLANFRLVLNGQDRFKDQTGKFFNQVQPFWHHSGNPCPGVYAYSFALKPEEHQPTGTCNFSRIDNATVAVTTKAAAGAWTGSAVLDMYAVNYNVFKIQNGLGGIAFSN